MFSTFGGSLEFLDHIYSRGLDSADVDPAVGSHLRREYLPPRTVGFNLFHIEGDQNIQRLLCHFLALSLLMTRGALQINGCPDTLVIWICRDIQSSRYSTPFYPGFSGTGVAIFASCCPGNPLSWISTCLPDTPLSRAIASCVLYSLFRMQRACTG